MRLVSDSSALRSVQPPGSAFATAVRAGTRDWLPILVAETSTMKGTPGECARMTARPSSRRERSYAARESALGSSSWSIAAECRSAASAALTAA